MCKKEADHTKKKLPEGEYRFTPKPGNNNHTFRKQGLTFSKLVPCLVEWFRERIVNTPQIFWSNVLISSCVCYNNYICLRTLVSIY